MRNCCLQPIFNVNNILLSTNRLTVDGDSEKESERKKEFFFYKLRI